MINPCLTLELCAVLVGDCVDNMGEFEVDPSEHTIMLFGKVDRCLRVLEQVCVKATSSSKS